MGAESYVMLKPFTANGGEAVGDILKRVVAHLIGIPEKAVIEIRVHHGVARERIVYSVHLRGSDAVLRTERAERPSLVVIVGADALRRIAEGLYSPVQAYLDGKMKLGGDIALGKRVILHLASSGSHVDACPVPASNLVPWNGYPTIQPFNQFPHWLILKCAFSDDPTARTLPTGLNPAITDLDTYINLFLSLGGVGTGNIIDYYRDVSYGGMDIETTVMGWYPAPFATNNTLDRFHRIQEAANAVPDSAGIDFSAYDGIVLVTNKVQDGGAEAVGKQAITIKNNDYQLGLVVFDPNSMYTAFAAHEFGHGLGLQHSFDNSNPPVEYGDPFDVMSALNTKQFISFNYPAEGAETTLGAGPGLNIPNLLTLGVLPSDRLAVFVVGNELTAFTIAALSHPEVSAPLGIKIVNPAAPDDFITIEYLESDGWEQGLFGANTVLIHEFKVGSSPYSFLQRHTNLGDGLDTGMWQEGYTWVNRNYPFRNDAFVAKIDPESHTATINVNSFSD